MRRKLTLHILSALFVSAGLLVRPAPVLADGSIKRLVLEDCDAAKQALASTPQSDFPTLVQYLVEVLKLNLSELLPPAAPRVPRIGDANPSRIEPPQVDPLRVVDPEEERRARRCAVDLLGMIGAPAAGALPELVRYATQNELDDASRNVVRRATISIAERSEDSLPLSASHELVAGLDTDNAAFVRSIFLLMAPRQGVPITEELIAQEKVPVAVAARAIGEIAGNDPARLRPIFESRLIDAGPDLRRVLQLLGQLQWRDLSLVSRYAALLLSEAPSVAQEAGALLQSAGTPCAGLSQVQSAPYLPLLERPGYEGEAATEIVGCLISRGEIDPARFPELLASPSALVRGRICGLLPRAEIPPREKVRYLIGILGDTDASVHDAALRAFQSVASAAPDDACPEVLKLLKGGAKNPKAVQISDPIPALTLATSCIRPANRQTWIAIVDNLLTRLAERKGGDSLSASEVADSLRALRAIEGDPSEVPAKFLKRKAERERFLGAQLLLALSSEHAKYLKSAVELLGDEQPSIRLAALRVILDLKLLSESALRAGIQSKNGKLRGVSVLILPGLSARKPAEIRAAKEWLQTASCTELAALLPQHTPAVPELRQGIIARLPECLGTMGEYDSVARILAALRLSPEELDQLVSMALDTKFDAGVTATLALAGPEAGFSPGQTKQLIGIVLDRGDESLVIAVTPAIRRLQDDGKELLPVLKRLADKPDASPVLRCKMLGSMSFLSADAVDWKDYFREEMRRDEGGVFSTCADNANPAVVQPVLVELLRDAPIRNRAIILRTLAVLPSYRAGEDFRAQILSALAAENQDVRCQATRVAARSGIEAPEVVEAIRTSLYGECWDSLRSTTGAEDSLVNAARVIVTSARNNLELARGTELFNLQTKGQLKR